MSDVKGNYEPRHVTAIREGDLVWDDQLTRWRRVTTALRYTTAVGHHDMVKLVFDISTYVRNAAGDDAWYDVLLDDEPHPSVTPETATRRRKRLRGRSSDEPEETTPEVSPDALETAAELVVGMVQSAGDVRTRREALGIARAKFAEICGLTAGALWRVEDGRPKGDELTKVIAALESQEARQ